MEKERYLLETIRNVGVGLTVAGIVGLLFNQTSLSNGVIAILYGCTSIIVGLILIEE